jgi:hypothetical protein
MLGNSDTVTAAASAAVAVAAAAAARPHLHGEPPDVIPGEQQQQQQQLAVCAAPAAAVAAAAGCFRVKAQTAVRHAVPDFFVWWEFLHLRKLLCLYCLMQMGFILEHDYKKRLLLDGLHVARFYMLRGSFITDVLAVLPVVYQVTAAAAAALMVVVLPMFYQVTAAAAAAHDGDCAANGVQVSYLHGLIAAAHCHLSSALPQGVAVCRHFRRIMPVGTTDNKMPAAAADRDGQRAHCELLGQPLPDLHHAAAPAAPGSADEGALCGQPHH